ncbi:terminase large subunit [Clostridium sp. CF012]|uniref:terminase large subunit n=1 Tax=Clostridium sp. CF012 TaxID=2843319 RepID=UPI001C0B988B|nr:terminase TerL endonuclease subunit [Clostridium sp. CF012]MBU3145734.1 terminase large subunit [Clostridium sp. CF012]
MDRVLDYCNKVLNGEIIAGASVKMSCERHIRDLENSKLAPYKYTFDISKANDIIQYSESLILIEGSKEKPLNLYPFQDFILGSLMGWVSKETGFRRFRESYIQVARQQGKSLLSGVLTTYFGNFVPYKKGLILLFAVDLNQAKIVYTEATKFIESDQDLQDLFNIKEYKSEIECLNSGNLIRAISKNAKAMDGFRTIFASADELHNHAKGDLYNLVKDGQADLDETLLNSITTAGFTIDGFCHKKYRYCKDILEGKEINEEYFIFISELDEEDDIEDINNWYKAKPALQYDVTGNKIKVLENSYREAKKMGGVQLNNFLTKHLNMWVEYTDVKFMNMKHFRKCACDLTLEDFRGRMCSIGLDLSSGGDLTSLIFEFTFLEGEEKKYFVHQHSFIPALRVEEHKLTDNAPYGLWITKKLLTSTTRAQGIKTDYKEVLKYIKNTIKKYELEVDMIYYDEANASAFLADLEEIADCLDVYQNSKSLNDSVMDIKYEAEACNLLYNKNDELLVWAMNNAEITKPVKGKVMLDKNSRFKRIDPIAAWTDCHKFVMRCEAKSYDAVSELDKMDW